MENTKLDWLKMSCTCLLILTFHTFALCTEPIERPHFTTPTAYLTSPPSVDAIHLNSVDKTAHTHSFIDDFACDADNGLMGWSNCNHIHSKYHGPFNNLIPNTIFRHFECDPSSVSALISFSIVFDCNVAFTDTVLLSINNHTIAQHTAATQEDRLNDSSLFSISNCDWYVDRNISYLIPLTEDHHSFELKFETIFKINIDKNIAIFDIGIDCVQPEESMTVVRDDTLKCHRYYTNSNSKSNIAPLLTMKDNFIAFALQYTDPRITTELALSHFNGEDIKKNTYSEQWYWSIQLELSKKQILLQNKSTDTVTQTIFPSKFRIKDEEECYLDINDAQLNVFWNCDTGDDGAIWSYNDDTNRLYTVDDMETYLTWDPAYNETKVTLLYNESDPFYMVSANEFRYNSYRIAYGSARCQITKHTQQSIFTQTNGAIVTGYRAVFRCDGNGANTKMEITQLTEIEPNDWTDLWITSFGNDNIKIGIGEVVGKAEDVIFSFAYDDGVYTNDVQCAWISTEPLYVRTYWRFYDYYNDTVCDVPFIEEHPITQDMFNHVDEYSLYGNKATYLPTYLWTNPYLLFEVSSPTETWMRFKMATSGASIMIYYGKQNVKGICESKAEEESYYVVIAIDEYYICSEYADYRLAETWLFWIQWNDPHVLEIGNGGWIGQSVIAQYDGLNAFDIESISIGCTAYEVCEWGFYTQQQQLVLLNTVFSPQSKLLFTYDYDVNMAHTMFDNHTSIDIYSHTLNLNYALYIDDEHSCLLCDNDVEQCVECRLNEIGGIAIPLPDYNHIAMHKTFDTEYQILLASSALLLKETRYVIQRNRFMNVSIAFTRNLMIDGTLKVSQRTIHNDMITQNASYIQLKSTLLGIDAVLCINYAANTCVICDDDNDCVPCDEGIPLGRNYIEKRMHLNTSFPPHYTLSVASSDTILNKNKHKININNCGIGSGLLNYKCMECPPHSINLFEYDNECHTCLQNNGYICEASNIWIDHHYWLTIAPSFEIISSICPSSHCCQSKNGCSYHHNDTAVCALNRDPTIPLCGGCLPGYAEVYGDTHCLYCPDDHYEYLLILLGCALLYVMAISCVFEDEASITHAMQNFKCSTLIVNDSVDALFISLFHCLTYFYQSMSYILIHYYGTERVHFVLPLLQIFSMDLTIKNAAFCFLSDLDALSKELWLLMIPFALFVALAILWMALRCISCLHYAPNFKSMLWCLALLSFSAVTNRLFSILSCRQIGTATIHFIAPEYECFDAIWWIALSAILFVLITLSVMFCMIYEMNPDARRLWTTPYTPKHWYWEFVLLSRRLWTSALITFDYLNQTQFNIIFAIMLMFCLGFHLKFEPFKYNRINHMESIALVLLLVCFLVINLCTDEVLIAVVIIPALLLPFVLFVSRIYFAIKLYVSIQSEETKLNQDQQKILLAAIDRLPRSRRDMILAIIHKTMPHKDIESCTKNTLYIVTDTEQDDDETDGITMLFKTDCITDFISKTGPEERTANLCSETSVSNTLFVRNHRRDNHVVTVNGSLPSRTDLEVTEMTQNGGESQSESERNRDENDYLLSTMAVGSRTVTHTLDCKIKKFSLSQSDQKWMPFDTDDDEFLYQTQPTSASSY